MASPNWYPDPAGSGGLRWWDGYAWTTHTAPAVPAWQPYTAPAPAWEPEQRGSGRRTALLWVGIAAAGVVAILLGTRALGLHTSVTTVSTGDSSVAEFGYSQQVRGALGAIDRAAQGLHPVCDQGGQKQGCFDASQRMASALWTAMNGLTAQQVPPRYETAHYHLLAALNQDYQAFGQRGLALQNGDDSLWQRSNDQIAAAAQALQAALAEYPPNTVVATG